MVQLRSVRTKNVPKKIIIVFSMVIIALCLIVAPKARAEASCHCRIRFSKWGALHYYNPQAVSLMRGSPDYFCTPIEAERAGYSANLDRYEFPHLKTD